VRPRDEAARPSPKLVAKALPGPSPRGRGVSEAARLNAGCEGCHAPIAAEWRASLHSRSHTDEAYQRAYAREPLRFCQGCHAPEADTSRAVPEAAAQLGVACVTCHVVEGELLGATTPSSNRAAPHAVVRDARLDGNAACATCHEFEFPDRSARRVPELMQSTLSEHARSAQSDRPCASCHMPLRDDGGAPHRSHAFLGGHDPDLVKSAVDVAAERRGDSVRVTLAPRELGHAFPTGDLFRRLEVTAEAIGPEWQVSASQRRYLTRHWQREKSPFGLVVRRAVQDDRPLASAVQVDLPLGSAAAHLPIAWRVAYQRVEHPRSDHEDDSQLEGEIELANGTLEKP